MNKTEYLNKRNELLTAAQDFVNEGKLEDAKNKRMEIENLDKEFEAFATEQANLSALKDNKVVANLSNITEPIVNATVVENSQLPKELDNDSIYENAFAKTLLGRELTNDETTVLNAVNLDFQNAFTHDTGNTGILIPETVAAGIWKRAEEDYPLYGDARKYQIKGLFTIKKHEAIKSGDAAFYDEDTPTADEENEFGELKLSGHELAKSITVSWKLRSMAVPEFLAYIQQELGERVGVALGTCAYVGTGVKQIKGVKTVLASEAGKPQIVEYENAGVKYTDITKAISKMHSSYSKKANIYVNNETLWNVLANVLDGTGRPLFVPDPTGAIAGRILGKPVKEDAGISDGDILFGSPIDGYVVNVNEPLSLADETHVKTRKIDYAAYAIVDGDVLDTKAFAILTKKTGA